MTKAADRPPLSHSAIDWPKTVITLSNSIGSEIAQKTLNIRQKQAETGSYGD